MNFDGNEAIKQKHACVCVFVEEEKYIFMAL